jgi:hypothetical protein
LGIFKEKSKKERGNIMTLMGKVVGSFIKSTGVRNALSKVAKCGNGVTSANKFASKNIFKSENQVAQYLNDAIKTGKAKVNQGVLKLNKSAEKNLQKFIEKETKMGKVETDPDVLKIRHSDASDNVITSVTFSRPSPSNPPVIPPIADRWISSEKLQKIKMKITI